MKRPRRLNRMPREREQIMEKVFQGALAIIRKHKALQAAKNGEPTPAPKPKLYIKPRNKA